MAQQDQSIGEPRAREQKRLVQKIAVSVAGFLITFGLAQLFTPDAKRTDLIWNIGASLFVAGIVFISQFLFEVAHRLDTMALSLGEHVKHTRRQMEEGFSRIHLASELFALREAAQLKAEEMAQLTKLVRNSSKITSEATEIVQEFAQAEITRLADYLKRLGDASDLTYEGEDRDWLLGLTKVIKHSLRATSLSTVDAGGTSFIDGGLWRRDLGLRYLEAQRQAIKRGVKIQRIFIIDRRELSASNDLNQVLRQHIHIGVEVRRLDATAVRGVDPRLRDFIIFDGVLSYQSTSAAMISDRGDPIIVNTALVTDAQRVSEREREFADLWNDAEHVSIDGDGNVIFAPVKKPVMEPAGRPER
ncbi:MAG TPA: hypothetical protein VFE14_11955 [Micromonosporaceae bacterium]|nr:hypothetical protein [Micromonosporaceae bacterium]